MIPDGVAEAFGSYDLGVCRCVCECLWIPRSIFNQKFTPRLPNRSQNRSKIDKDSKLQAIKKAIPILNGSECDFDWFLKRRRKQKHSKTLMMSFKIELCVYTTSYRIVDWILIDFRSILGGVGGPKWSKNRYQNDIAKLYERRSEASSQKSTKQRPQRPAAIGAEGHGRGVGEEVDPLRKGRREDITA